MKTRFLLRGLAVPAASLLFACSGTQGTGADETGGGAPSATTSEGQTAQQPGATGEAPSAQGQGDQEPSESVDRQRRELLVKQGLERARRAIQLKLYEDALHASADVLELDPNNDEARGIFLSAEEVLGDEVSRIAEKTQDKIFRARIAIERDRYRAMQLVQQADAKIDLGRYGDAIDDYDKALLILKYNPWLTPGNELSRTIEAKLKSAQQGQVQALRDNEEAAQAKSRADLEESERQQRLEREERVKRLMMQANRDFQLGNFRSSIQLLDQVLRLEPNNAGALQLHDLASRANHDNNVDLAKQRWKQEWVKTFDDLNMSSIPQSDTVVFDLKRWAEVSQQKPLSFTPPEELESPEERAIMASLESTSLEHNFSSATINDWSKFYASVTGVNFVVGPSARELDEATTTLTDFHLPNMSVKKALNVISSQTGVKWVVRDGVVLLVSSETPTGKTYLYPYPVRDLVLGVKSHPGPKLKLSVPGEELDAFFDEEEPAPTVVDDGRLQDLIRNNIEPTTWDEGISTMSYQAGVLLVRSTRSVHQKIDKLLTDLRRAVGIQVDVEARFLRVEDNFLEDIGVDFRGLGDQSSQGIPGRGLEKNNNSNVRFNDFGRPELITPASPGEIGTGTEPGVFFDDGGDGDLLARTQNLYDHALGGGPNGMNNAGGLSLQYAYLGDTEVEVILRAVQKQERSEQIVAPRLLVFNNTRAHMQALRATSYIADFGVEIAQAAAVANPEINVVRDGVVLDVRPVVSADRRFITMELRPTVMELLTPIPTFTTTLGTGQPVSIQLPTVTLQSVRTTVTMPDGGSILLGGMKLAERQKQESGVPILKDLPGLSFFFSRKGSYIANRKIIVLMRARIIVPAELEPDVPADEYQTLLQNG